MPNRQECPSCHAILLLPEGGRGRCPRCKTVVEAVRPAPTVAPVDELEPVIPEISAEHETDSAAAPRGATPASDLHVRSEPLPAGIPLPPALPSRRRRARPDPGEPDLDLAKPLPPASKVTAVTLLTIGLIVSVLVSVGSAIYLIAKARERPAPFVAPMNRR